MKDKNMDKFQIELCSDYKYEELVVDLSFGNGRFAVLNCDEGLSQAKIKIQAATESTVIWEFNYHEFLKALTKSYEKLKEANQHVITE